MIEGNWILTGLLSTDEIFPFAHYEIYILDILLIVFISPSFYKIKKGDLI